MVMKEDTGLVNGFQMFTHLELPKVAEISITFGSFLKNIKQGEVQLINLTLHSESNDSLWKSISIFTVFTTDK